MIARYLALAGMLSLLPLASSGQAAPKLDFDISVPADYSNPAAGRTTVSYELGAAFSPRKPTVFVIADAQQFYVRKGAMAQLQASLFDSSFNVVGIIGRNTNDDLKKSALDKDGNVDWARAANIFCWKQYAGDIDRVRERLLGARGRVLLYGQSGGGYLVHQYLSLYGRHVRRAFVGAAVNGQIDRELRVNTDRFWEETTGADSSMAGKFRTLLRSGSFSRDLVAMLFQRQNFFVKLDSLQFEREKLLDALLAGDTSAINGYRERYQINDILSFYASPDGIPIRVRLFEFLAPRLGDFTVKPDTLRPDVENLYYSALPLVEAYNVKRIAFQPMDFAGLHRLSAEVFILAGRWDHTSDYRSQIALASMYPDHCLFIANDNHTFVSLKNEGLYSRLLKAFLGHGLKSVPVKEALEKCEPFRWRE